MAAIKVGSLYRTKRNQNLLIKNKDFLYLHYEFVYKDSIMLLYKHEIDSFGIQSLYFFFRNKSYKGVYFSKYILYNFDEAFEEVL